MEDTGDILVRSHYLDTFRRSEHLEPENALLAAILEDAVEEYRKYSGAHETEVFRVQVGPPTLTV